MILTKREQEVLNFVPYDSWVTQFELGTSKLLLSKLCKANLIVQRPIPNPSRDPRKGLVYQRKT